jgi:hypothetical protein
MYTADRLWEEAVYIAYYLHWPLRDILDLEHPVRARVIQETGRIHERLDALAAGSAQGAGLF